MKAQTPPEGGNLPRNLVAVRGGRKALLDGRCGMFSDAMAAMTVEKARGQLANEAADLIWAHIYEGKKLSSDDLNFVLAALQWFGLWPATNANYAKDGLIDLLQQRGW